MMDTQYISRRTLTQQRNVIDSYALLESLEESRLCKVLYKAE